MSEQIFFKKDGKVVGLYDICEWWLYWYPEDVFITKPVLIVQIREAMKKLLDMRKPTKFKAKEEAKEGEK